MKALQILLMKKRKEPGKPILLELKARSFFFFPRAMDEIQTDRKKKLKLATCWSWEMDDQPFF